MFGLVTTDGELTTATLYPYWNDEPNADMSVASARTTVNLCRGGHHVKSLCATQRHAYTVYRPDKHGCDDQAWHLTHPFPFHRLRPVLIFLRHGSVWTHFV